MPKKQKSLSKAQIAALRTLCSRYEAIASAGVALGGKGEKFPTYLAPLTDFGGFSPQVSGIIKEYPSLAKQVRQSIVDVRANGARNKKYGAGFLGDRFGGSGARSRKAILTDPSLSPEQVIEELAKLDKED